MTKTIPLVGDISSEAATAVIDALLLSIINAYPEDSKNRDNYRRLNEAKSALFGIESPKGRKPDDDLLELMLMADAYIAERGEPKIGARYELQWADSEQRFHRSAQALARMAISARQDADPDYKLHSDEKIRNLQQKFSRNIAEWLSMSYGQEGMAESVFYLKIRELFELLEPLGVAVKIPDIAPRKIKSRN